MSKKLNSNRLIVNANAPVAEIKITIDNRYDPPEIQMQNSHMMPASIVLGHLLNCAANVTGMIIAAEAQAAAGMKSGTPPNLPPAPNSAEN